MGAHNIDKVIYTDAPLARAYADLVEQARYEDGHDSYSGTIATTDGVRQASTTPMTLAQARAFSDPRAPALRGTGASWAPTTRPTSLPPARASCWVCWTGWPPSRRS